MVFIYPFKMETISAMNQIFPKWFSYIYVWTHFTLIWIGFDLICLESIKHISYGISSEVETQTCCEQLCKGSRSHYNWSRNLIWLTAKSILDHSHNRTILLAVIPPAPYKLYHWALDKKPAWCSLWDAGNMSTNGLRELREGRNVNLAFAIMIYLLWYILTNWNTDMLGRTVHSHQVIFQLATNGILLLAE